MKKFNHLGIPTTEIKPDEIHLPHLKMYVTDHEKSPNGIQWMRFEVDAPYPELVLTVPHVAFEVENLDKVLEDYEFDIISEPDSPSKGVLVAMIKHNGAPIELIEFNNT